MSAKVFNTLQIYNIFPTEKGSTVIKSREIASQKMFLIHNALGEDSKIFDPYEVPELSETFGEEFKLNYLKAESNYDIRKKMIYLCCRMRWNLYGYEQGRKLWRTHGAEL